MTVQIGELFTFERTFTEEDVKIFTGISKDEGEHHIVPNEYGQYVVHGLLTATLPTKIGGDLNALARKMEFEFIRPVFSNDTITCTVKIDRFELDEKNRMKIATSYSCTNQHGKEVMKGNFSGVIINH